MTAREDMVLHQQVMKRMDKHPEGTGWMVPATPQPKGYPFSNPALIPPLVQAPVQDLPWYGDPEQSLLTGAWLLSKPVIPALFPHCFEPLYLQH